MERRKPQENTDPPLNGKTVKTCRAPPSFLIEPVKTDSRILFLVLKSFYIKLFFEFLQLPINRLSEQGPLRVLQLVERLSQEPLKFTLGQSFTFVSMEDSCSNI